MSTRRWQVTAGQIAMSAVMKNDVNDWINPATVSKARTILAFTPLLADDVANGMLSFWQVYREAHRKKVEMRMAAMAAKRQKERIY